MASGSSSMNSGVSLNITSLHQLVSMSSVKLKPENYLVWRNQMLQLMKTIKVTSMVKEEPPQQLNEKGENTKEYQEWEDKDALIRSWLSYSLSDECQYLIVGCESAKQAWECLEENFLQSSKEKEFQLKERVHDIKLDGRTLDEYIKEFKGLCDGLAAIHKPLDEDTKVISFARGLGQKYNVFRAVMLSKPPYPTLLQLITSLKGFDIREDSSKSDNSSQNIQPDHSMAFAAIRAPMQHFNRGRFQNNRGRGFVGHNQFYNSRGRGFRPAGHYNPYSSNSAASNSPNVVHSFPMMSTSMQPYHHRPSNPMQAYNRSLPKTVSGSTMIQPAGAFPSTQTTPKAEIEVCQICGRSNHIAPNCFYRWDYSFQTQSQNPTAMTATNYESQMDNALYVDSGATSHMTNNTGQEDSTSASQGN